MLVVPTVPGLSFLSLIALGDLVEDGRLAVALAPLVWVVVGGLVSIGAHRVARGVGIGLVAGGATAVLVALVASYGGWSV